MRHFTACGWPAFYSITPSLAFMLCLPLPRASWQKHMCDVLDGRLTLDDVEGVVAECMSKAEDIKQQLIVLETPPAGWCVCVWGGGRGGCHWRRPQ